MNQPTLAPSREGSRPSSAFCQFPSWEGLGVGSEPMFVIIVLEAITQPASRQRRSFGVPVASAH